MCVTAAVMLVAGAAAGAAGSIMAGNAQRKAADAEAATLEATARENARSIRKKAAEYRSGARADYAASGVDVASASALAADRQIVFDSETDAQNEIIFAGQRATARRAEGRAAQSAGYLQAASTVLGAASTYSSWKKAA